MVKGHKVLMFLIFLLLGILINLQFRSILDSSSSGVSVKDMAQQVEAEKEEGRKLLDELNNIKTEKDQLLHNIGDVQDNPEIRDLIKKRDFENFRAGFTAVSGDGIIITMKDAPAPGDMDIADYIIHDQDINGILNELKTNGAEAISINGERILGTSKLVCAGPTIFINRSRFPPPYVIKAIGNPDILYDAIDQLPDVAVMRIYGIQVDIVKQTGMVVEKYQLYQSIDQLLNGLEVVPQ